MLLSHAAPGTHGGATRHLIRVVRDTWLGAAWNLADVAPFLAQVLKARGLPALSPDALSSFGRTRDPAVGQQLNADVLRATQLLVLELVPRVAVEVDQGRVALSMRHVARPSLARLTRRPRVGSCPACCTRVASTCGTWGCSGNRTADTREGCEDEGVAHAIRADTRPHTRLPRTRGGRATQLDSILCVGATCATRTRARWALRLPRVDSPAHSPRRPPHTAGAAGGDACARLQN